VKKPFLWIVFLAALVIIGCGGGGGGDTTGATDGSTGFSFGLTVTPASVAAGESAQGAIHLSGPAPAGGMTFSLSSNSGAASVPGSVTVPEGATTRTFTINTANVQATTAATITASFSGNSDSQILEVRKISITTGVVGVVRSANGDPLGGAKVRFYQANGTFISEVTTTASGSFEATLPTSAKQFTVDISGVAGAGDYFNQFGYADEEYIANETGCLAAVPTFTEGQVVSLSTPVVFMPKTMGPPPPPTGCL
jgi:hypothetical protein